jgi:hypothetical protein
VTREGEIDVDQRLDVGLVRFTDLKSLGNENRRLRGNLAGSVRLLLAEAEAKPSIDELGVRGRHECVLARPALVDPTTGCRGVEIAYVLGALDCVARELDPDVLPPGLLVARGTDEKSDDGAVAAGDHTRCILAVEDRSDLGPEVDGVGQQRLGLAVSPVSLRKQVGRGVQMLRREGRELQR